MKPEIEQIVVVTQHELGIYSVGVDNIAKIKDKSLEWENHIDHIFEAVDHNGNVIKKIINCPVDIRYFEGSAGNDKTF